MVKRGANHPFTEILNVKGTVTARDRSDAGPQMDSASRDACDIFIRKRYAFISTK